MSRASRNQRDKRAEAFALHRSDAPFSLSSGDSVDPRTPWQLPGHDKTPDPAPGDPWGYEPTDTPVDAFAGMGNELPGGRTQ